MPILEMPDGTRLDFPDGTTPEAMDRAARDYISTLKATGVSSPAVASDGPAPAPAPIPVGGAPQNRPLLDDAWDGIQRLLNSTPLRDQEGALDEKRIKDGAALDIKRDFASRGVDFSLADIKDHLASLTGKIWDEDIAFWGPQYQKAQELRLRQDRDLTREYETAAKVWDGDTRTAVGLGMGALVAYGLATAPVATLLGVAGFEALGRVKAGALEQGYRYYTKTLDALGVGHAPYRPGEHENLRDFAPDGASIEDKQFFDILEFAALAKGAHALTPLGRSILETATQKVLTDYKMPESLFISPEKIRSIFQTGEGVSPEEMDLIKGLGLTSKQYREAMDWGLTIEVPASKILTVADRPWYARAKGLFGFTPYEAMTGREFTAPPEGKRPVAGALPEGQGKPVPAAQGKPEPEAVPSPVSSVQDSLAGQQPKAGPTAAEMEATPLFPEERETPAVEAQAGKSAPDSSDMAYLAMQNEAQARSLESAMKRRKKDQGTKHSNIPWSQDAETETLGNFLATVDRIGGLDRAHMEANYPPAVVAALDAGGMLKKGGALPEDAAGFLGYQTESAMFDAVHGALSGKLSTLEAMRASASLGDSIARYSLDSEEYASYLAEQEKILGRMLNGPRTNKQPRILGPDNPTVGELQVDESKALEAALKRAEQAARKAFREGNIEGALVEKELQQALVRRAIARRRMHEEVAEIKGALEKAAGNTAIPLDYQDQVADLLDAVDVRRAPKTQRRLDSLADFLARQEAAGEDTSYIPVDLIERMKRRPLNDFDIQELRDLRDSVESIIHLGTLKNKLLTSKSKRDFNSIVNDLVGAIHEKARLDAEDLAKMNPEEPLLREARPGLFGFARGAFSDGMAKIQGPEFIIRALDGFRQDGPAHEALWGPTKHANDAELLRLEQHRAAMERILAPVLAEGRQFFSKRHSIPGVRGLLTKEEAVSVALNSQRPLNVRHLVNGNKFKPEEIKAIVNWLEPQYRDMVSQVWDYNESLFEAINENHIALTGKRLQKTPGRYYPAAINWKLARRGDTMLERMANNQDGFEPQFFVRPGTSASFRQEATGGDQALRLDLNVWVKHLMDEATDTTRTVVARDMSKLLLDQRVKQAIVTARGEGEYRALIDWLKSQRDLSKTPQDRMMRLGEAVRNNMTSSQLALNITNILQQPFSLLNVFSEPGVGPADVAKAFGEYIADPRGMTRFATSRSVELRARIDTKTMEADRDMAAMAKSANALDRGIIDAARRAAFLPTIIMDQVATVPTWLIGYRKGLLDYAGNEAKAIDYADSLMARTQSSGDKLHRPAVMNKQGWTRFFTMFMTWQMNYTNQFRENLGRVWDNPDSANVIQAAKYIFWGVVMQQVLQSPLKYGRLPDKKELARDIVTAPVQGVPFLKDFVNPLSRVFTGSYAMPYRVSPMERIPQAAIDLAGAMTSKTQDARARAWLDAVELGSYATGLPTRIGTNVAHGIETKKRTGKGNALNLIVPRQQEPRK